MAAGAAAAAAALQAGELVVFPTDTVYGVAALASDAQAVVKLQEAKGRGADFPPPVLVADLAAALELAPDFPAAALSLARAFWPGALTLIVPAGGKAPQYAQALGTIALRVPAHDGLRGLLDRTGPLATSSANRHDGPPATTAAEAQAQLGAAVALYLDGGPTPGDTPSTIVSFAGRPRIVRAGSLAVQLV
jgi:tRNA threonylcarbamoyl adenosine modification protein (Sua5/YciO/YrdC/YwlC family)